MDLLFLKPFLHFLRIRGLNYTVREYYRILHLLNLKGDWGLEKFRQVLKKVLVKNKDHALIFTQCFEDFFNTGIQTDADTKKDIEHNADIPVILNEVKDYNRKARKNPVLSLFTHSDNKEKNTEFSNISQVQILINGKTVSKTLSNALLEENNSFFTTGFYHYYCCHYSFFLYTFACSGIVNRT